MTEVQKKQFNIMLATLRRISKEYSTPEELRKESEEGDEFFDYEETLEMAYDNIQSEAANACKGVKEIK